MNSKVDTVFQSHDSTVVFIQEFVDSLIMKEYYGSITNYQDDTKRYGFLWLKKGTWRTYELSHIWGEHYYTEWKKIYPGLRIDHNSELMWVVRIE